MLPEVDKAGLPVIEIPRARRNPWAAVKILAAVLVVGGPTVAWFAGYRPSILRAGTGSRIEFVEVGRGDVDLYVVETGSIESSMNTTIRCEVEALIGLVGGAQGATGKGGASGSSGQGTGGASGTGTDATTTKSKTAKKKAGSSSSSSAKTAATKSGSSATSGSSSSSGTSGSSSGSSSSSSASGSGSGSGGGGGGMSGGSASSGGTTGNATATKPVLRSFTYVVVPYVPARPATPKTQESTKKQSDMAQGKGGGGGGGRGGGGRGGRGGGGGGFGGEEEKPGSTRIVSILPEGSRVKTGDVVAKLDSSSYEEEARTQQIRYLQAKAYVEQAQSMLEVAEITLREYRDGIFPQDMRLLHQYIESCEIEQARAAANLKWSEEMLAMSFRTPFQVKGDRQSLKQTEIALSEARGMLERLSKYTAPKLIKTLEANVAAIRADLLTQEASFVLEDQRLKRLQRNIDHCKVTAPGDGIVVYANQSDWRGMASVVIDEGVTLREKQPIFNLPDPKHMRVRAKINESKVALVQTGQPVQVLVDAYPERPLKGVVAEVVPISIPIRGSDVRIYYANIEIKDGFDALRPGLSAEILVEVERRENVTRVPIDAIRWSADRPYVAVHDRGREAAGQEPWKWREIEVGLSDPDFIEVVKGLNPGDRIVAQPANLPAPAPERVATR
jgi:HlyD family secretion protein